MKMVLFDIDSTLLKDAGASNASFCRAFKEMFSVEPISIDKHGKTDPAIARETAMATIGRDLTPAEGSHLHARYAELLPDYLEKSGSFSVLKGAIELCTWIYSNPEYLPGIQTGNLEACAWSKLKRAKLDVFFSFGGFGSDSSDRTQLVRIAIERGRAKANNFLGEIKVFLIGDSCKDIVAGNDNGAFTIGVTTGKDRESDFVAAGASAIVRDLTAESGIYDILDRTRI
jgi:phosphoglycolate phosphatase-like HAD superfamily hydrolase